MHVAPDTIHALLEERDALKAENEMPRKCSPRWMECYFSIPENITDHVIDLLASPVTSTTRAFSVLSPLRTAVHASDPI